LLSRKEEEDEDEEEEEEEEERVCGMCNAPANEKLSEAGGNSRRRGGEGGKEVYERAMGRAVGRCLLYGEGVGMCVGCAVSKRDESKEQY
jgi:hypothetical protein